MVIVCFYPLGYIITGTLAGVVFGIHLIAGPFITPALRRICLPFVPATEEQVENVFRALKGRKGKFVDLGSGDGRLVSGTCSQQYSLYCNSFRYPYWSTVFKYLVHAIVTCIHIDLLFTKFAFTSLSLFPFLSLFWIQDGISNDVFVKKKFIQCCCVKKRLSTLMEKNIYQWKVWGILVVFKINYLDRCDYGQVKQNCLSISLL